MKRALKWEGYSCGPSGGNTSASGRDQCYADTKDADLTNSRPTARMQTSGAPTRANETFTARAKICDSDIDESDLASFISSQSDATHKNDQNGGQEDNIGK